MARSQRQKAAERGLREARQLLAAFEEQYEVLGSTFDSRDWQCITGGLTTRSEKWRADLARYLEPATSGRTSPRRVTT